ncbi:PREDICTED: alanine racemase-like [Priapulus caudatus]|uniref:Alanine racemase-like n=1 Tax=Priapulus caudatus TaxID=37621 RepID=A0ABM1DQR1_PRICU|nr:PREDICTED: alanine racemase-like [Priapulus caudatus]
MSRYGVQCDELEALMQDLHALDVGIESIFTHFAGGIMDNDGNLDQFNQFMACTDPLVNKNISRHAAATTGCCQKIGTELDFVRPGGSLYGLCSGNDLPGSTIFQKLGFQPAMSIIARPTFYKLLPAGRHVGYDRMYTTDSPEWIANIACGWSDGYRRQLSFGRGAMKNNRTGELCPIAGRISMDSCTLKLPQKPQPDDTYSVLTADYADRTSYSWMARALDAANYEITGTWSTRLPRVYIKQGEVHDILHAVDYSN